MHLTVRVFLFLLLPFFGAAQNKLVLTGKISGIREGQVIALIDVNKPADTIAAGVVKKGTFVLTAKLPEPLLINLQLGNGKNIMSFVDNSPVTFTGDIAQTEKIKTSGSAVSKSFGEFRDIFSSAFDRLTKMYREMQYTGQTENLVDASKKLQDTLARAINKFIKKHDSSPVSAFLLAVDKQFNDDVLVIEKRLNQLKPAALDNLYGHYLKQYVEENKTTAVGSTAMDFTQADTLGKPVSLSSFRGKYVLVDFWASWCGPCRQENPNVVATYNKFKQKNFTVLGVSLDRPGQKEKWLQAIHNDKLDWTHVSDLQFWSNAVALQYRIQSIPQNFLIGPDGRIVAKNLRGRDLEAKLCEVLGCN